MTDRVPGAPGQYQAIITAAELAKLQSGEAFTITLTRDDQPITNGTPYSKAAVLPDELAAQICPEVEDPTPADALKALLPLNGSKPMKADLPMDGNKITGLGAPTDDGDAVNKAFLDAQFEFTSISPTLAPDAVGSVVIYKKSTAGSGYVVNIWLGDVTANAGTYTIGTFAESVPSCAFLVFGAKGSGIAYCYVQENVMYLQILSTAQYSEWWKGHIGL